MTREDALEIWLPIIKMGVKSMPECYEAVEMAIKALEQKPCTDAISRQAVLDKEVYTETSDGWTGWTVDVNDVKELPPVTPTEKVGHWIDHQDGRWIYAKCSECETIHDTRTNYCPNCGSRMMQEVTP